MDLNKGNYVKINDERFIVMDTTYMEGTKYAFVKNASEDVGVVFVAKNSKSRQLWLARLDAYDLVFLINACIHGICQLSTEYYG